MKLRRLIVPACAALCFFSLPASADVKAGVDAWTRGDYPSAVKEWQSPAAKGDADAQYNMGQAYKWGKGLPQDLKKAELYYGKAAAQGHMRASDEYGLILFDRGEHAQALPYVKQASERGDSRAQYLIAIAHFNGDLMPKDWVRAYALMSLARGSGLAQAGPGLQEMDGYIPLAQRQQGAALSQQIAIDSEALRNRELASADLGVIVPSPITAPSIIAPPVRMATASPVLPTPEEAVAAAERVASGSSPRSAGADYARPAASTVPPAPRPVAASVPRIAPPAPRSVVAPPPTVATALPAAAGSWRIQFGAFSVAANADALWTKVKVRPELAGHGRINVASGAVTKLQAGGYSEAAARSACGKLAASAITCVAVKN